MTHSDVLIIGGGIIGMATGYELSRRFPRVSITLLDKEHELALHQTGRNSGVLHSGIYYKPGSLKAINCLQGKLRMQAFCEAEGVQYSLCGKIIVATSEDELPRLREIEKRGQANGVACPRIPQARIKEFEPHCAGIEALHVPSTGIVDYTAVCRKLAEQFQARGNHIVLNARVLKLAEQGEQVRAWTTQGELTARFVINCAGLHSDRVAALNGGASEARIVPFRGEYFELRPEARHLCTALIYPVPDPRFPFLGVHFTRIIAGGVECGPNAVLALAREGYRKTDFNPRDALETLTYSGFLHIARKYGWIGLGELWRSINKRAFVRALQKLIPEIRGEHLDPAPAGVRAQAVAPDGCLLDDFTLVERARQIDVINAPSPAATAALSIAAMIVDRLPGHALELR